MLQAVIKRRADDFFQAEVKGVSEAGPKGDFQRLLERVQNLVRDLQFVKNQVEPCFPPDYKIFEMHL